MVIGEETIVPRGIQKGVTTPVDPEQLKKDEKRIPDQIERNDEAGTPELPVAEDEEPKRETLGQIVPPEDFYWTLDGEAEGEPILDAPVEPEPEIDIVEPERDVPVDTPPMKERPRVDPTPGISIVPEPDRSPGAPPSGPPGFPGPDSPEPSPTGNRH